MKFLSGVVFQIILLTNVASAAWWASAGKADITPDLAHEKVWLAGFGAKGRKMQGVHDPLYARALIVSDGKKTVALVAIDCIGLYREDILEMRRRSGWDGKDRYLFVSAIHDHSGPDTLGLWGPLPGVSGVDSHYRERVIQAVADLVQNLSTHLDRVRITAAQTDVNPKGLCTDSRDPVVIDPELDVVQARSIASNQMIGTLVRWSCHPEVMWDDSHWLTADYPGVVCRDIEKKTGGSCLFQSGVIGGLLTPEADRSGGVPQEFKEMDRIGGAVADEALAALKKSQIVSGSVFFKSKTVLIPLENSLYLLFLPHLTFGHKLLNPDGNPLPASAAYWLALRHFFFFPLPKYKLPWIETEVSLVQIGSVKILGIPGELFPELAIGGYDGRYAFGHPLIKPNNPNPPNLSHAPKGPYLREQLHANVGILVGLANDELGYIVPNYDFKVTRNRLLIPHPKGDHYEETNSVGPSATPILLNAFDDLLAN